MEARLELLETRLAYQDKTVEALNEVVTRQQDQIDRLEHELRLLKAILQNAMDPGREPRP